MATPNHFDRLRRANARPPGVPRWTEPVILGCAGSTSPSPGVGRTIHSIREDRGLKLDVVGHDRGSEVVRHSLARLKYERELVVGEGRHDLEGTEYLRRARAEIFRLQHLRKRNEDRRRLHGAVNLRYLVILQLLSAEEQFGSWNFQQSRGVVEHGLGRDSEYRPYR